MHGKYSNLTSLDKQLYVLLGNSVKYYMLVDLCTRSLFDYSNFFSKIDKSAEMAGETQTSPSGIRLSE